MAECKKCGAKTWWVRKQDPRSGLERFEMVNPNPMRWLIEVEPGDGKEAALVKQATLYESHYWACPEEQKERKQRREDRPNREESQSRPSVQDDDVPF